MRVVFFSTAKRGPQRANSSTAPALCAASLHQFIYYIFVDNINLHPRTVDLRSQISSIRALTTSFRTPQCTLGLCLCVRRGPNFDDRAHKSNYICEAARVTSPRARTNTLYLSHDCLSGPLRFAQAFGAAKLHI